METKNRSGRSDRNRWFKSLELSETEPAERRNQMTPKHILPAIAIVLAAVSYAGWPTLGAAVIILAAANFVP